MEHKSLVWVVVDCHMALGSSVRVEVGTEPTSLSHCSDLYQPLCLRLERLAPRQTLRTNHLFKVHNVLSAKVAVQMRTPVGAGRLIPFHRRRLKVGEPQLDEIERRRRRKEEVRRRGNLEHPLSEHKGIQCRWDRKTNLRRGTQMHEAILLIQFRKRVRLGYRLRRRGGRDFVDEFREGVGRVHLYFFTLPGR
jgi:hypothetical protein